MTSSATTASERDELRAKITDALARCLWVDGAFLDCAEWNLVTDALEADASEMQRLRETVEAQAAEIKRLTDVNAQYLDALQKAAAEVERLGANVAILRNAAHVVSTAIDDGINGLSTHELCRLFVILDNAYLRTKA